MKFAPQSQAAPQTAGALRSGWGNDIPRGLHRIFGRDMFAEVRDRFESIDIPKGQPFLSQLFYLLETPEVLKTQCCGLLDQIDVLASLQFKPLPGIKLSQWRIVTFT